MKLMYSVSKIFWGWMHLFPYFLKYFFSGKQSWNKLRNLQTLIPICIVNLCPSIDRIRKCSNPTQRNFFSFLYNLITANKSRKSYLQLSRLLQRDIVARTLIIRTVYIEDGFLFFSNTLSRLYCCTLWLYLCVTGS